MSTKNLFSISALMLLAVMSLQLATAKVPEQPISVQRKLAAADPRVLDSEKDFPPIVLPQNRHIIWDCSDLPCDSPNGIYPILGDDSFTQVMAYCDFSDNGTGWTVIQRRQEVPPPGQQISFNRDYDAYRYGFGSLYAEFWWGLEHLWRLTAPLNRVYELRVDLTDFNGESRHALYHQFKVASIDADFRLTIAQYNSSNGNAGDGLTYHNGMKFSVVGTDNDACEPDCDCAGYYTAGWWYNECYISNLNGIYLGSSTSSSEKGITWGPWLGYQYSLKGAQIKIRPV